MAVGKVNSYIVQRDEVNLRLSSWWKDTGNLESSVVRASGFCHRSHIPQFTWVAICDLTANFCFIPWARQGVYNEQLMNARNQQYPSRSWNRSKCKNSFKSMYLLHWFIYRQQDTAKLIFTPRLLLKTPNSVLFCSSLVVLQDGSSLQQ